MNRVRQPGRTNSRNASASSESGRSSKRRSPGIVQIILFGLALVAVGATVYLSVSSSTGQQQAFDSSPPVRQVVATEYEAPPYSVEPRTLDELLRLPDTELVHVDVARMNLLCASALPSTQGLDIDHALVTLDVWAETVAVETDRHLYRVTDPRYAEHYGHSEAQYRAEMLAQVLHEDLGVRYNPTSIDNFSFADASVAFLHGMIPAPGSSVEDTSGGTCVSMPVLYVSVGRRLGYPLELVTTDSHIFVRWDGTDHPNPHFRGRFNIETTNGFSRFDDAYYRTWPKPVSDREIAENGYLESLNPPEVLAQFLAARGHHGYDVGQAAFAARCYENAHRYDPRRPAYRAWFAEAASRGGYRSATPGLFDVQPPVTRPQFQPRRPQPEFLGPTPTASPVAQSPGGMLSQFASTSNAFPSSTERRNLP